MKNFLLGSVFTLAVLAIGGFVYLRLGLAEVRTDIPSSDFESKLMRMAVHASVRRHAPEVANPVSPTVENLLAGAKVYANECSGCHGAWKGKTEPDSLNPPAPRLVEVRTEYTEAQAFWVAKHGIRHSGMFANGLWDDDQKLWTAAAFLTRIDNLPTHVVDVLNQAAEEKK